jgi:hypothetical protein
MLAASLTRARIAAAKADSATAGKLSPSARRAARSVPSAKRSQAVRAGDGDAAAAECGRDPRSPAADDSQTPPSRRQRSSSGRSLRHTDRVGRVGKLHQGTVEVEKQRCAFEELGGRRAEQVCHRSALGRCTGKSQGANDAAMVSPFENAERLGLRCRPMTDADLPFLFGLYASTRAEEVAATGWLLEAQLQFLRGQFDASTTITRPIIRTRSGWWWSMAGIPLGAFTSRNGRASSGSSTSRWYRTPKAKASVARC